MSPQMEELYKKDVRDLYKIFTNNDSIPETVKKI